MCKDSPLPESTRGFYSSLAYIQNICVIVWKKTHIATKYVSKIFRGILSYFPKRWRQLFVYVVQARAPTVGLSPELWGHFYVYTQSRREMDGELGSHSYFPTKWNSYWSKKNSDDIVMKLMPQRKTNLLILYFPNHYSYFKPEERKIIKPLHAEFYRVEGSLKETFTK